MKKQLALVIIGSLCLLFPAHLAARSRTNDAPSVEKIKIKITRLGVGEKARAQIKLRDGEKIKGHVSSAGPDDFAFTDRKSGQTTTIAYADVVEVKKPGMSKSSKILIGVGIGVVATAAILAVAVKQSLDNLNLNGISIR